MNSKVSFFNWNYFKENMKKSRGIIYLFVLMMPIFTYLFMLMLNNTNPTTLNFPSLSDLSIPALIGMYIVPFVMAITLFNFLFKKDSVDFINALPLKRETIYMTNIIGGIGIFFIIFLLTSLVMIVSGNLFSNIVIPNEMYFHYFLTFFVTYSFTFIASSLTLSLTGSRMVHVALTLIILFIPGFICDFYTSRVYDNREIGYAYDASCGQYDTDCIDYGNNNNLTVENSFKLENGQTLPYKYISTVPREIFGMYTNEVTYQSELFSVYNVSSILRMIILSVIYFALGLYAFISRKMEVAESTFKNENIHQLVKCITLFPLSLAAVIVFAEEASAITLWIMLAVIITIYAVYDLITRRNSGKFMKSVIYFLGLVLATIIIYLAFDQIGNFESSKVINKEDVANIGIVPNSNYGSNNIAANLNTLKYKITDPAIIAFIFDNIDKDISTKETSEQFAMRFGLENGSTYYFNIALVSDEYDKLLDMLDKNSGYASAFKSIPYDEIYGVKLGDNYINKKDSVKVVDLIKKGFEGKSVSDIVTATYMDYQNKYNSISYNLMNTLYVYDNGISTYSVSTMINPELINLVLQTTNANYIENIKNKSININNLSFSFNLNEGTEDETYYYEFISNAENREVIYRYINDNIKSSTDFSKYDLNEIVSFTAWHNKVYQVFLIKDANYEKLFNQMKEYVNENPNPNTPKDEL